MSQQAGWYDDPQDSDGLRYWDGVQWTDHTSPKQRPNLDQAGQGATPYSAPGGGQQQGYGQQGYGQQQNPYAGQTGWGQPMPGGGYGGMTSGNTTPDGQPLGVWGMRLLARIIDAIIFMVLSVVLLPILAPDLITDMQDWTDEVMQAVEAGATTAPEPPASVLTATSQVSLVVALSAIVYEIVLVKLVGGSLGKLMTGLRVRSRGTPGLLGWGPAALRGLIWPGLWFLSSMPAIGIVLLLVAVLDGLWPLWDKQKQALHDKAVKTNVVKKTR